MLDFRLIFPYIQRLINNVYVLLICGLLYIVLVGLRNHVCKHMCLHRLLNIQLLNLHRHCFGGGKEITRLGDLVMPDPFG